MRSEQEPRYVQHSGNGDGPADGPPAALEQRQQQDKNEHRLHRERQSEQHAGQPGTAPALGQQIPAPQGQQDAVVQVAQQQRRREGLAQRQDQEQRSTDRAPDGEPGEPDRARHSDHRGQDRERVPDQECGVGAEQAERGDEEQPTGWKQEERVRVDGLPVHQAHRAVVQDPEVHDHPGGGIGAEHQVGEERQRQRPEDRSRWRDRLPQAVAQRQGGPAECRHGSETLLLAQRGGAGPVAHRARARADDPVPGGVLLVLAK